ncbi:MAG: metallophosphoesterase [Chloroflexota bacterium]
MTTIFFATDVHGSDICWNKFINAGKFYGADVLVLGGDMTGKAIVPILKDAQGVYHANLLEQQFDLRTEEEVQEMVKRIKSRGYYPYLTDEDEVRELSKTPDKVHDIFLDQALKTLQNWLEIAERKLKDTAIQCYVCPGNDDMPEVDALIRQAGRVRLAEGQVIQLDKHHEMISSGWSNPTPWKTYREESEDQLRARYEAMITGLKNPRASVFNVHVPPHASMLDDAPELDENLRPKYAGNAVKPVGSKALRQVIEKHQPLLGLHGHIHESRGASRIGKSLCINPGSMYEQGTLLGALVKLGKDKIDTYVLTSG